MMLLLLLLSHFSRVPLCATPETAAHEAPPSLGFSRQEHWSGLPYDEECLKKKKKKTTVGQNFSGDARGPYHKCTAATLTETLGCLAPEVHGIQTHGALRGSHVQSHIEPVRDVVVHALLKTPAEFWREILF